MKLAALCALHPLVNRRVVCADGKGLLALEYQLKERTQFIESDDAIVADLFYLLGTLYQNRGEDLKMHEAYKKSIRYSDLRKAEISERKREHRSTFKIDIELIKI